MKKPFLALFVLLSFLSFNAFAIEISRHMSGSWYNPAQDGHGLSVEILAGGRAVVYWYVYNPDGTPTFLIAIGDVQGDAIVAPAYHVTGMRWGIFDPAEKIMTLWGEIALRFQDCNHASLGYLAQDSDLSIPNGWGDIPLVRLASVEYLQCNENRFTGIYEGFVERNETGEFHRAKAIVDADERFVLYAEGAFMAFGDFDETNVNEAWSQNTVIFPLAGPTGPVAVPDFSARFNPEDRMFLSFYTMADYGYGFGELPATDRVFREGVTLQGPSPVDSIERRWWLRDMISGDYALTEILNSGTFSATSDQTNCSWNGQVSIPDPLFNRVEVTVDIANCGALDGHYSGMGYHANGSYEYYHERVLHLFARSETNAIALVLIPR